MVRPSMLGRSSLLCTWATGVVQGGGAPAQPTGFSDP